MSRSSTRLMALAWLALAGAAAAQPPAIPTGPWRDIFNQKDLTGWFHAGTPPWSVANGILSAQGGTIKTMLIWNEPLKDVEVEVSYRLSTDRANSGIQVRSQCLDRSDAFPKCGNYQVCGLQLDVAMNHSGKLFEECVGFLVNSGQNVDGCRRSLKVGEWMTTTARFKGPNVSLWLNGTHCLDYTLSKVEHLTGSIFALQSHPPFDRIDYRSVRIRNLENVTPVQSREIAPARSVRAADAGIRFSLGEAGPYRLRVRDPLGTLVLDQGGLGPVPEGTVPLEGPGVFVLELEARGRVTRHTVALAGPASPGRASSSNPRGSQP